MGIDAHCQDLNLFLLFGRYKTVQLSELLDTVGSPVATVKNEDDLFFVAEI